MPLRTHSAPFAGRACTPGAPGGPAGAPPGAGPWWTRRAAGAGAAAAAAAAPAGRGGAAPRAPGGPGGRAMPGPGRRRGGSYTYISPLLMLDAELVTPLIVPYPRSLSCTRKGISYFPNKSSLHGRLFLLHRRGLNVGQGGGEKQKT